MLISEIYQSRQGEGLLTGTDSVFIRTSGCNLRCGFCDTPYASWQPEGESLTVSEILTRVETIPNSAQHVVITGGEPMLPKLLDELTRQLHWQQRHITIETAGTVFRDVKCDLISISPKLSNSTPEFERAGRWQAQHERTRHRPDLVRQLMDRYEYQLKFVVGQPSDIDEIDDYLQHLGTYDQSRVLLMPEGIDSEKLLATEKWLEPICQHRGFKLCRREHIHWYGNRRAT